MNWLIRFAVALDAEGGLDGLRLLATALLVVALAITAASTTGASQASLATAQADAPTVWLMDDAQANWPESGNRRHPGVQGAAPRHRT